MSSQKQFLLYIRTVRAGTQSENTFSRGSNFVILPGRLYNRCQLLKKELAPSGANSFLQELTLFHKRSVVQVENQEFGRVASFVKWLEKKLP